MNPDDSGALTRIFFVRHGVTDKTGTVLYGRTKGISLNEEGRNQAELMGQYFEPIKIDAVFSSPLERALETAEIITHDRGLDINVNEGLSDTDVGSWTNMKMAECNELEQWKNVQATPSQFKFPQGESFVDVFDRMSEAVRFITTNYIGKNIVVTSHRDPIIILLASYLGVHMDSFQRIPCKPASLTEVAFINGIGTVESVNVLPAKRMA